MDITIKQLEIVTDQRFALGKKPRPPKLAALAAFIEHAFPQLSATVASDGYCNTDRKLAGTRLRIPGKGRRGNTLTVKTRRKVKLWEPWLKKMVTREQGEVVFTHNAAETYRSNYDVISWILERKNDLGLEGL